MDPRNDETGRIVAAAGPVPVDRSDRKVDLLPCITNAVISGVALNARHLVTARQPLRPANIADGAPEIKHHSPEALPSIGSPLFTEWALHDTAEGHARNALTVLQFCAPGTFSDAEIAESLGDVERRLAAVVYLLALDRARLARMLPLHVPTHRRPLGASPIAIGSDSEGGT